MKKYFKESLDKKVSLKDYFEKESSKLKPEELRYRRIHYIYETLGDVPVTEDFIDGIFKTWDKSVYKYGSTRTKQKTVETIYEISKMFPELTKESIEFISSEYIKDLFDKYSLIDMLAILIRKEGLEDSTFERYMEKVLELAKEEDKKYSSISANIRIYFGEYSYDFVRYFEKVIEQYHVDWKKFCDCIPSPEIFFKDQMVLKELSKRSKECWGICDPISFKMFESYLAGDEELSEYEEQPYYYVSTYGGKTFTPFTRTEFLGKIKEKIEERQKTKRK